jgi:ISXO2-like transposase domain/Transposase zinc-ribbon domain
MPPHADIHQWEHLPFPKSLPQFQRLFPDDAECARWLEGAKWPKGFICPYCHEKDEPIRLETRSVLACRKCRKQTSLTVGTVMERTHSPLTVWFWGAYLVSTSTPGISAVQFQRQLGLTRYETAYQILHKLRAGMVRPGRDRIGGNLARGDHVEIDETYIGGETRGKGKGVHADEKTLVMAAVEVRTRPAKKGDKPQRRGGRYAGRLRLEIALNRGEKALCGFVEAAVEPGAIVITDAAPAYATLEKRGYAHLPVVEGGDPKVAEEFLPIVHLVFSNLKAWLQGTHHGRVEPKHLQAYLNEFAFRFNRRFYPFNAFRSLLGIGANGEAPTYDGLYSGEWKHPSIVKD